MAGSICPLRWFIDYTTPPDGWTGWTDQQKSDETAAATVLDSTGAAIIFANGGSTVDDMARELTGNSPPQRQRVYDQVQGRLYLCEAMVRAIQENFDTVVTGPTTIDRPALDGFWDAHPLYTTARDLPDGTNRSLAAYWGASSAGVCSQWWGTARAQCCFNEDQATNDARSANLTVTAVAIATDANGAA